MIRGLLSGALALVLLAGALPAQVIDTTRADSLARDTTDWTGEFLRAQREARQTVPVIRRLGAGVLLPPLSRLVLTRDTIDWHHAETVADLLALVPGVYLWRGGWTGSAELPAYQGRGPASVEFVLDGIPYLSLSTDSTHVDPSVLPLSFFDRIEVERLPGLLRVSLFTRRHDRRAPRSRIGVASGDGDFARYQGMLEKRGGGGQAFALAFEHLSVPSVGRFIGDYRNTQGWIQLGYVRSPRFAVDLQYFQAGPDRGASVTDTPGDTLSRVRKGTRREVQARVALGGSVPGTGPTLDLLGSVTRWSDDVLRDTVLTIIERIVGGVVDTDTVVTTSKHRRTIYQLGAVAGWRTSLTNLTGTAWLRTDWTPLDVRGTLGLVPTRFTTLAGEAAYQRHDNGRNSAWITGRAGISLPGGISAAGVWRRGTVVSYPMISTDEAQDVDDRSVAVAWRARFAEFEAGWSSTSGYRPRAFDQYPGIAAIAASGRTDWLNIGGRLSPRQWIVLDGWYSTPRGDRPEGQPPTHSVLNATIESRFLRTFPSGIFGLKLRVGMESWGTGVLGRDTLGVPVMLRGATFFRGHIALRLGSFSAYYDRYNLQGTQLFYVPRLEVPRYASTFGVRWAFAN